MHFETWNTKQIIVNLISKWLIINILEYSKIRATYHSDKWLLLWNKILRISEKWLFLRLSQLCVDELYLCWRERATRDWSQTTEAGIKDKPLPELAPCWHGRDLGEVLLGELAAPESSDRFFHRFYCLLFYGANLRNYSEKNEWISSNNLQQLARTCNAK